MDEIKLSAKEWIWVLGTMSVREHRDTVLAIRSALRSRRYDAHYSSLRYALILPRLHAERVSGLLFESGQ